MPKVLRDFFKLCAICAFAFTACTLELNSEDENPDGGNPPDAALTGLAVGSACASDEECTGPGVPQCLREGIYPLREMANSKNEVAQGFAEFGVPMPDGYCSTVPPCAGDGDCGAGGTCFYPLRDVDRDDFIELVSQLGLSGDDLASVTAFLDYGQCLQACETNGDCTREGYVCQTPIAEMLALVPDADLSSFCIGTAETCDPDPCTHGTCSIENGLAVCECDTGWEGDLCNQDVDDCPAVSPCQNGGACVDGLDSYSCDCAPAVGWSGTHCEINADDCPSPDPCQNGGVCVDGLDSYSCDCDGTGWTGPTCEEDFDNCQTGVCGPNRHCAEGVPGTDDYSCGECYPCFSGAECLDATDAPCLNGGSCTPEGAGAYSCSCPAGYTGEQCQVEVIDCTDDPCVHATACENTGPSGYTCSCEAGWDGDNCDHNIDDCPAENPCLNGGECIDGIETYSCDCAGSYTGDHCETAPTTSCTLTYSLDAGNGNNGDGYTGVNMRIRNTFLSMGDDTYGIGPGTLILRVPSNGAQNIDPDGGAAEILYYELAIDFTTTTGGEIVTVLTAASPEAGQDTDTTARALGTLDMTGDKPAITWNACTYPSDYNDDKNSFTPDVAGTGDGCLAPYRSVGTVTCNAGAATCLIGGLSEGPNPQNETWQQRLEPLEFEADFSSFEMPFMLTPNRSPSRTYLNWEGTRTSMVCE